MRQGVQNAAARFQDARALVRDDNLRRRAAAEVSLDLSGEVMDIHDSALDARFGEPVERMIDERAPGKPQERFRDAVGQRAHARAKSRRQHHRGVNRAAIRCFHIGSNPGGASHVSLGRLLPSLDWPHTTLEAA